MRWMLNRGLFSVKKLKLQSAIPGQHQTPNTVGELLNTVKNLSAKAIHFLKELMETKNREKRVDRNMTLNFSITSVSNFKSR